MVVQQQVFIQVLLQYLILIRPNILEILPANKSALSEVEYLNDNVIVYAGADGIKAYDISKNVELWTGKPSTAISVSQDGKNIASVYKDEHFATIYDAKTGKIKRKLIFVIEDKVLR